MDTTYIRYRSLIVTELCDGTLDHLVCTKSTIKLMADDLRDILRQITEGVQYLHANNIIHRDLSPRNILYRRIISDGDDKRQLIMKVADFGSSRHIPKGANQYERSVTNIGYSKYFNEFGTEGFRSSEVIQKKPFLSPPYAVDISPLGLIFAFTLLGGCHPLGEDATEIEKRIMNSEPMPIYNQKQLMEIGCYDLVNWMIEQNPKWRPTASEVLENNYFTRREEKKPLVGIIIAHLCLLT